MRTLVMLGLLLAGLIGRAPAPARADSWADPVPRIFAASNGVYALKVLPVQWVKATVTLFTLDDQGNEQVLRRGDLVNLPYRVFLSLLGQVITVDTYANLGYEHSLVVYALDGKVLADYKLEELLPAEEIATKVMRTVSSRWWTNDATFTPSEDGRSFTIKLAWGRVIVVDLATGRVTRNG
jgi:hypothetical protein